MPERMNEGSESGDDRKRDTIAEGAEVKEIDELPLVPWEEPSARKILPEDLRRLIGAPTSILRVSRTAHRKELTTHARDAQYYERLDELLPNLLTAGPSSKEPNKWDIFLRVDKKGVLVVIGRDADGSYNLVTLFSGRQRYFLKRLKQGNYKNRE